MTTTLRSGLFRKGDERRAGHLRTALRSGLARLPWLRRAYHDLDILLKHGSWRPKWLRLEPNGHELCVDPTEARGRTILRERASLALDLVLLSTPELLNALQPTSKG